ncbi:MAG: carboxypeptidase-like regulatory domain-containing protein, partial [Proteiniphilum sp.]
MNKNCIGEKKITNNPKHILRIMRITVFLLFLSIMFSHAATSRSQEAILSLKLESISIKEACREIEKETGMLFVFSDNTEEAINKNVNIEVKSKPLNAILDDLFFNTKLTYKILDKQIVVYRDEAEMTVPLKIKEVVAEITQQQKKTITGKITDKSGETVIGANIIEIGTTNGTVTDIDGHFSLSVEENANIRVSYIGYLSQTINTSGKRSLDIILQEDTKTLEEVVAVGYGTMRK